MQESAANIPGLFVAVMAIVGVVILFGMLAYVVLLFGRRSKPKNYDQARGDEMQLISEKLGFEFAAQEQLASLPIFSKMKFLPREPESIENLMLGEMKGQNAAIFDLVYKKNGPDESPAKNTILAIRSEIFNLPAFHMIPKSSGGKPAIGLRNLSLPSSASPSFSERYLIYGDNEAAIEAIFDYQVIDFFEANRDLHIFGSEGLLCLYNGDHLIPPGDIPQWQKYLGYQLNIFKSGQK